MDLLQHPFFKEFKDRERDALKRVSKTAGYKKNQAIFDEGDPSDALYLVLTGEVSFYKQLENGRDQIISRVTVGEFFGEVGLFTGETRALSAIATRDTSVGIVPREALLDFIQNTSGPVGMILQSIVGHLHHTTSHYIDDILKTEKMAVVGSMMNTIIHDFKNPFTLISLGAQVVMQTHEDEKTRKICMNIEEQIRRMVDMANEISDFSRGQQSMEFAPVNLKKLFLRFKDLNFPYFQKEHIKFEMEAEDITIEAEESKLIRILQNLVSNAIDSLEERSGCVTLLARKKDDGAEIIVKDNGIGIPEKIRARMFEPFVTFGKSNGTGLGTAIVKSIVEAHQGTIRFESSTNRGTTFYIWLPRHQPLNVSPRGE